MKPAVVALALTIAVTAYAQPPRHPAPRYEGSGPSWEELVKIGHQHVIVKVRSNPDFWDWRDVPLKPGGFVHCYPPPEGADLDLWCRDAVRDVGKCEKWAESSTLGQQIPLWGMTPIIFCGCNVGNPNSGRAYQ